MKKIIALLLAAIMVLGLAACASKTEPATDTTTAEPAAEPAETTEETPAAEEETPAAEEEAPAADDVKHVVYFVNGNLGDKSFFDSAQAGINELVKAGRITCKTIELGGTDEDQPKWLSTLYDVSESGEYDLVICGTYQMPDYLKEVATQYPDQLYLIFDDNTYAGNNSNVVNITYKQNDMGYLVGTYAACMTTDTNLDKINEDAVVGFVGGVDSPVINDFLTGSIEGALAVNPDTHAARGACRTVQRQSVRRTQKRFCQDHSPLCACTQADKAVPAHGKQIQALFLPRCRTHGKRPAVCKRLCEGLYALPGQSLLRTEPCILPDLAFAACVNLQTQVRKLRLLRIDTGKKTHLLCFRQAQPTGRTPRRRGCGRAKATRRTQRLLGAAFPCDP